MNNCCLLFCCDIVLHNSTNYMLLPLTITIIIIINNNINQNIQKKQVIERIFILLLLLLIVIIVKRIRIRRRTISSPDTNDVFNITYVCTVVTMKWPKTLSVLTCCAYDASMAVSISQHVECRSFSWMTEKQRSSARTFGLN